MEGEGDGKEREGRGRDIYFKNVPAVLYTLSPNFFTEGTINSILYMKDYTKRG